MVLFAGTCPPRAEWQSCAERRVAVGALASVTLDPTDHLDADVDELAWLCVLVAHRLLEPDPREPTDLGRGEA